MTNADEIAKELQKRCPGNHVHQPLVGGRAKDAAEYPTGLCKAICRGLMNQIRMGDLKVVHLMSVRHDTKIGQIQGCGKNELDDHHEELNMEAFDNITRAQLNPQAVRQARLKELGYVDDKGV